jgi:ribonuclease BN (tRNA processing enzyme)
MAFEVTVLGCGEAFDDQYTNTSLLLRVDGKTILLDCGYSAPAPLWNAVSDPDAVDLIYISHEHADHCFGLPAVLSRMWEDGRKKPLVILSQPAVLTKIRDLQDAGYPGLAARFQYAIEYREAHPALEIIWEGMTFNFATTRHSVTNLAVRLEGGGATFCYSGDGQFTDQSRALFSGAGLLIHEAYSFDPSPVHGDFPGDQADRLQELGVPVPEPGDRIVLC